MKFRAVFAVSMLVLGLQISCNNDSGTSIPNQRPTISTISPNRVSRGERGTITIQGTNFLGATQISLGNEVTIQNFNVVSANVIEVQFIVNPKATPGKRAVQVITAAGVGNAPDLLEVINNQAPVARIHFAPQIGATNTLFTFDALSTTDSDGRVVNYDWEFGDGKKGSGSEVTHKFTSTGSFEIILTATDNDGAPGVTTITVQVSAGTAPTAKFSITPKQGDVNTTYTFDAGASFDADGQIKQYLWDFGDGRTASGPQVQNNYKKSGVFGVTLTVQDNKGLENSVRKDLTVGAFDYTKATQEIRFVCDDFFHRYSMLHQLTAEQITINWSDSPGCNGRGHEIHIINQQKQTIIQTQATPTNPADVTFNSTTKAHAIAPADFAWTDATGDHTGSAIHDFEFIFEDKWRICNFSLVQSAGTAALFSP
jgi:PKD domain/IPT/TIG domain